MTKTTTLFYSAITWQTPLSISCNSNYPWENTSRAEIASEPELMEQFGVGRSTIREAIPGSWRIRDC